MMRAFGVLAKLRRLRGTRARHLRQDRRAQDGARADRRVRGARRRAPRRARAAQSRARGRARAGARAHPRLRPRQGSPRGRGEEEGSASCSRRSARRRPWVRRRWRSPPTEPRRAARAPPRAKRRFRRALPSCGISQSVGAPTSCSGGGRAGSIADPASIGVRPRRRSRRAALEHLVGQPDEIVLLLDRLLQANRVLGRGRAQRQAARAARSRSLAMMSVLNGIAGCLALSRR